ncbi:MAG: LCP family protein [Bacilli bacterium]|jgi:LCP family protein required for cell wall assembly|nr:LCP family protein [Bacilli bacterium]
MSEKSKKGHNIDFFRGNLSKREYDQISDKEKRDYRVFKFDPNKKTLPTSKLQLNKTSQLNKVNKNKNSIILDDFTSKNKNNIKVSQLNKNVNNNKNNISNKELNNAFTTRDEHPEHYNDTNIVSGKRKPLKPSNNSLVSNNSNNGNNGGNNKRIRRKKDKKPKKRKKWLRRLIVAIIIILLLIIASLFLIKETSKPVHFVVIGVDQREGQNDSDVRADALMMVNVSSKDNKIIIASVPRDTYTYIPCEDTNDKITHSYVYGALNWKDKGGAIACTTASVSDLVNVDTSKYIKLNFANTIDIVNTIGGIDLKATHTFCEQDSKGTPNKYCFEEGKTYHMDGEMALAYARHRKTDNDIARGLRQQEVFKAIILKVKSMPFWQWPSAYFKVSTMIDTNLSHKEMMQIAMVYAFKGDTTQYKFDWSGVMYNGISYVELDPTSVENYTKTVDKLN